MFARLPYKIGPLLFFNLLGLALTVAAEPVSIVAVGDLLLGGSASKTLYKTGFNYPFGKTRQLLAEADIAMANLEAPLTSRGEKHPDKQFTFRVPPEAAKAIEQNGFDLMTLANNHMGDYGSQGVLDTLETLKTAGIGYCGAGRNLNEARQPHIIERGGIRFAFLAYSNTLPKSFYARKDRPGTAPGYYDYVAADVERARKRADHVIVSFHWGAEKMESPKDYQRQLGHLSIDRGATVVIGHHPHVLQGAERYKQGVIYYSLGNFAFGSYSRTASTAGLARVWLDQKNLVKAEIMPLNVLNTEVNFRPTPLHQGASYSFARTFNNYSEPLTTRLARQPGPFWAIEAIAPAKNEKLLATEALEDGEGGKRL